MEKNGSEYRVFRPLYLLTLIWGIAIFWLAPRPPLIDLPQHAGQVALLHDLVMGVSPWTSIFKINLMTPYLIGYGLAFPLSFIMPVGMALKVILSVAYTAFVLLGSRLRANFGADPRLDWLFFPAFFGFAYTWGFYTFLASTPVVLLFLLTIDRYAVMPTLRRGIVATLVGLFLLLSHGLAFVFGTIVAGVLYTVRVHGGGQWMKRWLLGVWPMFIPGVACIIYYFVTTKAQAQYWAYGTLPNAYNLSIMRAPRLLINSIGDYYNPQIVLGIAGLMMVAAPWVLGLRLNWRNPAALVMVIVVGIIEFLVPSTIISTAYIYERFALFAFPAYALAFAASYVWQPAGTDAAAAARPAPHNGALRMALLVAGVWIALGYHSMEMWKFGQESKDFEPVLAAMEPGQRALELTFTNRSDAADLDQPYRHYASWYQSEKHGLVDFNFGWFPPQIVRFRLDKLPQVKENFRAASFTPKKTALEPYRYIIARSVKPLKADLFAGAACAPTMVINSGTWTLFDRGACGVTRDTVLAALPEKAAPAK
jgi:hypothetical protein